MSRLPTYKCFPYKGITALCPLGGGPFPPSKNLKRKPCVGSLLTLVKLLTDLLAKCRHWLIIHIENFSFYRFYKCRLPTYIWPIMALCRVPTCGLRPISLQWGVNKKSVKLSQRKWWIAILYKTTRSIMKVAVRSLGTLVCRKRVKRSKKDSQNNIQNNKIIKESDRAN